MIRPLSAVGSTDLAHGLDSSRICHLVPGACAFEEKVHTWRNSTQARSSFIKQLVKIGFAKCEDFKNIEIALVAAS